MDSDWYNQLKRDANTIRVETRPGQNTAERVGKMFNDIIDAVADVNSGLIMEINTGAFSDIAWGETKTITCRVLEGNIDRTAAVTRWEVKRDSGDAVSDAMWKLAHSDFSGVLEIMYNSTRDDIYRTDGKATVFTFTATLEDNSIAVGRLIF